MPAADFADAAQKFINSPPGQLVAGSALAGIVWKFFERVEAVLTETTKLELAVWLVGVSAGTYVREWPLTLVATFDKFFGKKQLTWKCFRRSLALSSSIFFLVLLFGSLAGGWLRVNGIFMYFQSLELNHQGVGPGRVFSREVLTVVIATVFFTNIVPDYLSILKTRLLLGALKQSTSAKIILLVLTVDLFAAGCFGILCQKIAVYGQRQTLSAMSPVRPASQPLPDVSSQQSENHVNEVLDHLEVLNSILVQDVNLDADRLFNEKAGRFLYFLPAFSASIWIWLYVSSGFLLKAARRFDLGFDWFNQKFDIEKKPLSAIGLVAGSLVAVTYWCVAATIHLLHR